MAAQNDRGSAAAQDRRARRAILLRSHASVAIAVGKLAERLGGGARLDGLEQDVAVRVVIQFISTQSRSNSCLAGGALGLACVACADSGAADASSNKGIRRRTTRGQRPRGRCVQLAGDSAARTARCSASARNGLASSGASGAVRLTATVSL